MTSAECSKAATIVETAHASADALLKAYELAWSERGKPRGMTTDEEQDLLRAMLVLAAAGLDSMVKQLIRDAVPALVQKSSEVRDGLEKFVARGLRGDVETRDVASGWRFLGRILAAPSHQDQVIEEYIRDLTCGSLQSVEELSRTATALGLSELKFDRTKLKEIFEIRNKIVHDLDVNLDAERRKRNIRGREPMMKHTNALLQTAEQMLKGVHTSLSRA